MKIYIGLDREQRQGVAEIVNRVLADEYVLYTKTRKYHWNVVGPQFNELHKFFQDQYEALDTIVDQVAERVRALGELPWGTLTEFIETSRIQEQPGHNPAAQEMLTVLLADHETIICNLRTELERVSEVYGDVGTTDFMTQLMEQHEKMAWMIRSFLEDGESEGSLELPTLRILQDPSPAA